MARNIGSQDNGEHSYIKLEGSKEEMDAIKKMLSRTHYLKAGKDGLEAITKYRKLPEPVEDPMLRVHWQSEDPKLGYFKHKKHSEPGEGIRSPSFYVSYLCGYNYTEISYRHNAEKLESYGFLCLRSKRDCEGRFHEIWYLPGLWHADGALSKEFPNRYSEDWKEQADDVVRFLCKNIQFGSCDVSIQRAAAVLD